MISKRKKINRKKRERYAGLLAVLTILAAWVIGGVQQSASIEPHLHIVLPDADRYERLSNSTYAAYRTGSSEMLLGYIALGQAQGYGGPLTAAVAVDTAGNILGFSIVEQRETASWYQKVAGSYLVPSLIGKTYLDPFKLGED